MGRILSRYHASVRRKKQEFMDGVLDSLSDNITVLDNEGNIIYFNKAWESFSKMNSISSFYNFKKVNYLELCANVKGDEESDAKEAYRGIKSVLDSKVDEFKMEYPCHSPKEKRWFSMRAVKYLGKGQTKVVISHTNITDRKIAEQKVKENEDSLKFLAENTKDIIYKIQIKPEHKFLYVSPSVTRITGYTPLEHYNNPTLGYDIIHPDDENILKDIAKGINLNKPVQIRWIKKDGRQVWIEQLNTPIYNENSELVAINGIARDITQRKQLEFDYKNAKDEAVKANNSKSIFLAKMSHEIRTPMNGIIGITDLLLSMDLDENQMKYMQMIKTSSKYLLKIINNILDYSKFESGSFELEEKPFNFKNEINSIIETFAVRAHMKGIDLDYNIDGNIPENVKGDSNKIQQILNNLIGNAIKFTDTGGIKIKIKNIHEDSEYLKILFDIKDTGIGIPKEEINNLFQDYKQVKNAYKNYEGTGLGLSISKQLAENMGGEIWAESEVGQGSIFSFIIRIKKLKDGEFSYDNNLAELDPDSVNIFDSDDSSYDINKLNNIRILLVEDNFINQDLANNILTKRGYEIDIASDGEEALAFYNSKKYDIVLMDIQMPKLNGYETTKIIRQKEIDSLFKTPIIAMTAHASTKDRDKFIEAGMDEHISKPIKWEILDSIIRKYTDNERVIDYNALIDAFDGNENLIQKLVIKLLDVYPKQLNRIQDAIKNNNFKELNEGAHKFKGTISNFRAERAYDYASKLEKIDSSDSIKEAKKLFNSLKNEMKKIELFFNKKMNL